MIKAISCLFFALIFAVSCGKKKDGAADDSAWGSSLPGKISTGAN